MRWEDPSKEHLVAELDREILLKWLRMSNLQEFTIWHDTNAIIKMLCTEMLERLSKEEPPAK